MFRRPGDRCSRRSEEHSHELDLPCSRRTLYAVWTGIGAAGTFLIGVLHYGGPASFLRYGGVALIIAGVVLLKVEH
ncbi:MAG: hypothetical protein JSS46_08535 [Proteobacteria bacterium]|jgi:multidrug transporter EmrE-like cation transporter|nr:hypothetical protein [Pseudomonadota bacterium]